MPGVFHFLSCLLAVKVDFTENLNIPTYIHITKKMLTYWFVLQHSDLDLESFKFILKYKQVTSHQVRAMSNVPTQISNKKKNVFFNLHGIADKYKQIGADSVFLFIINDSQWHSTFNQQTTSCYKRRKSIRNTTQSFTASR